LHAAGRLGVPGHSRVCLQLRERDVLDVVGLGPPELLSEGPGLTPEHCVAEQALPVSADQDQGYSSCWGRSSRISCHGAFEPTKMCAVGLSAGSSMSDPYATRTYVPSRAVQ
jgi:hypothetical protein